MQDVKTALGAQKEINRLLALYQPADANQDPGSPAATQDAKTLAEVRSHLVSLGTSKTSTVELARRAMQEIIKSKSQRKDTT